MKKYYKIIIAFSLLFAVAFSSCELYNPAEPIPAYIHIQKIDLTTTATQGTNSSKISDAWVYIDEQLIGCFELPATFPVLYDGKHRIRIKPGIKVNGIATNRSYYPFYNFIEQDIDLQKGAVTTLTPTTTYTSATVYEFMSDFETTGTTIDTVKGKTDTTLQILYSATPHENVFEGTHSAIAYLDPVNTRFECATVTPMVLPQYGSPVFLEFNYKCNYGFTVSIYAYGAATSAQFVVLRFNQSLTWNKAYVYLTPSVSSASSALNYKIAWGMINNTAEDSISLSLDNIKIIHN